MAGEGKEDEFTPLRGSAPPPGRVGGGVPFSPFPYGSPLQRAGPSPTPRSGSKSETQKILQTSFSGSPGQKLLLSSFFRYNPEFTGTSNLIKSAPADSEFVFPIHYGTLFAIF